MEPHTSLHFDQELESIRTDVLRMGGKVEEQIRYGLQAIMEADSALGTKVNEQDHGINQLEET